MSLNYEKYNVPFTASELLDALHKSHDTAAGPDDIHYQILKHLPDKALETLLNILNDIWITGKFPKDWSKATIIPIPKPNKDHTEAGLGGSVGYAVRLETRRSRVQPPPRLVTFSRGD